VSEITERHQIKNPPSPRRFDRAPISPDLYIHT